MALRRGLSARSPIRSQRRKTAWGFGPDSAQQSLTSTGQTLWSTGVVLVAEVEATIVRLRGEILFQLDLATSAGDGFTGAVGIGIVTSDAFAIGAGSMPGPLTNSDAQLWMWHQFITIRGVAAQSQGADIGRNAFADVRYQIDSKAMRIFHNNETLFGMTEFGVETGTAGVVQSADVRVLAKLT